LVRVHPKGGDTSWFYGATICHDIVRQPFYDKDMRRAAMSARTNRTEKLDLRLTPNAKRALQSAAQASHKTVSDFVLESALARADSVLADRQVFRLDARRWAAFMAALDAPPRPRPRLARLLREPSIVD
jgi:uncharacterized protein (DUF1778 family)